MTDQSARLYLVLPPLADVSAFTPQLEAALQAADVACVLLPKSTQAADQTELVGLIQAHGAAALVSDPVMAERTAADGVHVEGAGDLAPALRTLKPAKIVGVGGLLTRDEAMDAAERGVDYLMFGDGPVGGPPLPFDERLDQVAWWAEIFQVPCVALAHALSEVEAFAEAGAEFVALGAPVWTDVRGPGPAVGEATAALRDGNAAFMARLSEQV